METPLEAYLPIPSRLVSGGAALPRKHPTVICQHVRPLSQVPGGPGYGGHSARAWFIQKCNKKSSPLVHCFLHCEEQNRPQGLIER